MCDDASVGGGMWYCEWPAVFGHYTCHGRSVMPYFKSFEVSPNTSRTVDYPSWVLSNYRHRMACNKRFYEGIQGLYGGKNFEVRVSSLTMAVSRWNGRIIRKEQSSCEPHIFPRLCTCVFWWYVIYWRKARWGRFLIGNDSGETPNPQVLDMWNQISGSSRQDDEFNPTRKITAIEDSSPVVQAIDWSTSRQSVVSLSLGRQLGNSWACSSVRHSCVDWTLYDDRWEDALVVYPRES